MSTDARSSRARRGREANLMAATPMPDTDATSATFTGTITDRYSGEVPHLLDQMELVRLSRPNAAVSCLHVALEWGFIFGAIVVCERSWHPAVYALTVVWLGARQHALGILMHDAAHFRLTRNKRWNDWLSEPFLAWPIFVTTRSYRVNHFAHHRHVNTQLDPDLQRKQSSDWVFPKRLRSLAMLLLRDVTGLNTHEHLAMFAELATPPTNGSRPAPPQRSAYLPLRIAYYAVIIAALTYFHVWREFLLYWVVPYLTWMKVVLRIRSIAEHFAIDNVHPLNMTRTTLLNPVACMLVAPKNIAFHLEHHLYPSVPFFRLPALHRALMAQPRYRDAAHITRGYAGMLRECVRFTGRSLVAPRPS